jgi:hypothetical protein
MGTGRHHRRDGSMIVRGLVQRDPIGRLFLTKQGRDALDALLAKD